MSLEKHLQLKIKEKGYSLVKTAGLLDLNYHTLKSQLRNENVSGDALVKIACLLDLDLNKLKEDVYSDINNKCRYIEESEYLMKRAQSDYIIEGGFEVITSLYFQYGEKIAEYMYQLDDGLDRARYSFEEYQCADNSNDRESCREEVINSLTHSIIRFHLIPDEATVKSSIGEYLTEVLRTYLNVGKNDFKCVNALYESSVFKKNIDLILNYIHGLDQNSYYVSADLLCLMELSADGYGSTVGDYFEIIRMQSEFTKRFAVDKAFGEDLRSIAFSIYDLGKSVYRALVSSDIDTQLKRLLGKSLFNKVYMKTVGFYDCNVEVGLKIITKEDEEKWMELS